jgi:hypothetical protein
VFLDFEKECRANGNHVTAFLERNRIAP